MENASKWKETLNARISKQPTNLGQLVYGQSVSNSVTTQRDTQDSSESEDSDGEFLYIKGERKKVLLTGFCILSFVRLENISC